MASQFYIIFLIFSILIPSSLSSPYYTFHSLDVSASVQSTLDIFSLDLDQHQPFLNDVSAVSTQTASFVAQLHSRASIHPPRLLHDDYTSLTRARLARDSARVASIFAKVERVSRAEEVEYSAKGGGSLTAPLRSSAGQGSGEYFTKLGVGTPAKASFLVVDTGSDVTWLQCKPCSDCYKQSGPIFDPSSSSSYAQLPCESPACRRLDTGGCSKNACQYQVSYGDGSYTIGDFVTETVSFSSSGSVPKVAVGCGHDNEGLFVGSAGLLGLGGGGLSLPSQIKATSFSYCLVDRDSRNSSTLEINPIRTRYSSVTAPILKNDKLDTFYYIGLTGFSVGGKPVSIPQPGGRSLFSVDESGGGGVIVDSGTSVTRLPTQAYTSVRDAFTRQTRRLKRASSFAIFDTCYDFSDQSSVKVPTVALNFDGGGKLELPAKNYLIPVDTAGTFCFAFAETTSSMSIIGNVQQQGTRVRYDLANSQLTFSQHSC